VEAGIGVGVGVDVGVGVGFTSEAGAGVGVGLDVAGGLVSVRDTDAIARLAGSADERNGGVTIRTAGVFGRAAGAAFVCSVGLRTVRASAGVDLSGTAAMGGADVSGPALTTGETGAGGGDAIGDESSLDAVANSMSVDTPVVPPRYRTPATINAAVRRIPTPPAIARHGPNRQ